jgi:hypothetical protein
MPEQNDQQNPQKRKDSAAYVLSQNGVVVLLSVLNG